MFDVCHKVCGLVVQQHWWRLYADYRQRASRSGGTGHCFEQTEYHINLNCNDVQKELYKTTAEQYFKNDAERLKQNLQEVLPKQYCFRHPTL